MILGAIRRDIKVVVGEGEYQKKNEEVREYGEEKNRRELFGFVAVPMARAPLGVQVQEGLGNAMPRSQGYDL